MHKKTTIQQNKRNGKPTVPDNVRKIKSLADLIPDDQNANKHTQRGGGAAAKSVQECGLGRSIVVDRNGKIIGGNQITETCAEVGIEEIVVVPSDGRKLVVVQRTDLDLDKDARARKMAILDNRVSEVNLDWDVEQLLKTIAEHEIDLKDIEFSEEEIGKLEAEAMGDREVTEDEAPEVGSVPSRCKAGELWTLGEHRLLCGDSTKPEDVARVMDGKRAVMVNTDAPYGVDYAAVKNGIPRSGFKDIQARGGDIENDDLTSGPELQAFLERAIKAILPHLIENPAFYFWHPMLTQGTFFAAAAAAAAADILIHRQIIWVKPHMVLTRSGMYHWQHELCFYGWIKGRPCNWYGNKSQTSVWEMGESQQGRVHPTQKPVELFARPMPNHTRAGDVVYEPFSGSGSQLMAAEQLERRCYGIEIAPKYCDVIVARWEKLTGKTAEKVEV